MGGFGSGRQGGGRCTDDMRPLDVRKINRGGLLTPGRWFSWQWTCNEEVTATISLRVEADRVVLDVDVKGDKRGEEQLADLQREHGALPATASQMTSSGGHHELFAVTPLVTKYVGAIPVNAGLGNPAVDVVHVGAEVPLVRRCRQQRSMRRSKSENDLGHQKLSMNAGIAGAAVAPRFKFPSPRRRPPAPRAAGRSDGGIP